MAEPKKQKGWKMIEITEYEKLLTIVVVASSFVGAIAGVSTAFLNESPVYHVKYRIVLALLFSTMSGLLVLSMMLDINHQDKSIVISTALFSILFGIWSGQSANRKIDDRERATLLVNDVLSAESIDDIERRISVKAA